MSVYDVIKASQQRARGMTINEKLEDTFGPNPCQQLALTNTETGETIHLACDTKRCIHCGPRKRFILQHELEQLGHNVHIGRTNNIDKINTALEAMKKRKQRHQEDFRYTIVGDPTSGWLLISDVPIIEEQRYMELREWMARILDLYHHAVNRIRRSVALIMHGLSVVPRSPKSDRETRDNPSPWEHRTLNSELIAEAATLEWDDLLAELNHQHGDHLEYGLPDPF